MGHSVYFWSCQGVGPKIADCILLYGFRKLEAFRVDVWIQKIMERLFKVDYKHLRDFARDEFGKYAGYVQLIMRENLEYLGESDDKRDDPRVQI